MPCILQGILIYFNFQYIFNFQTIFNVPRIKNGLRRLKIENWKLKIFAFAKVIHTFA